METHSAEQDKGTPQLAKCLEKLSKLQKELEAQGVLHAHIFGSVARGEATKKSDIDIIVEVKRGIGFGVLRLAGLQIELSEKFGRDVDLVSMGGLKFPRHDNIKAEMVQAF
ncbi:MAG TPA: nucleotidyltransferase domain-containing protein [Candidatus Baltobacteraceae bacterium]|nr:nucleotidyltransferase domain-containing protein [Candidatus Baltobacteraceae bacterium]